MVTGNQRIYKDVETAGQFVHSGSKPLINYGTAFTLLVKENSTLIQKTYF